MMSGATENQLRYWTSLGMIVPAGGGSGAGNHSVFFFRHVFEAAIAAELNRLGVPVKAIGIVITVLAKLRDGNAVNDVDELVQLARVVSPPCELTGATMMASESGTTHPNESDLVPTQSWREFLDPRTRRPDADFCLSLSFGVVPRLITRRAVVLLCSGGAVGQTILNLVDLLHRLEAASSDSHAGYVTPRPEFVH